jgi:hypothetical protein
MPLVVWLVGIGLRLPVILIVVLPVIAGIHSDIQLDLLLVHLQPVQSATFEHFGLEFAALLSQFVTGQLSHTQLGQLGRRNVPAFHQALQVLSCIYIAVS